MSRTRRKKKWVRAEKSWNDPTFYKGKSRRRIKAYDCPNGGSYKKLTRRWDYS